MQTLIHLLLWACLSILTLEVQSKSEDRLATFFRTKNGADLPDEAQTFLTLWRSQQRSNTDGYDCNRRRQVKLGQSIHF